MTIVTTKSGFTCEVNEQAVDNMEMLEVLAELANDNVLVVPKFAQLLLSKEGKKRLYDYLRTEDGRVPTAQCSAELMEIFQSLADAKK